jgi:hypothetical protein
MPLTVGLNPDHAFVEARFSGKFNADELSAAIHEIMQFALAHNVFHLLADCTALAGGHSLFDLFGMVDILLESGHAHKIREAIVLPVQPEAVEKVAFWETACINRGIRVRVFADCQDALNWLISETSSVPSGLQKERKHG